MSLEDFPDPPAMVIDKEGVNRPAYVTIPQPEGGEFTYKHMM